MKLWYKNSFNTIHTNLTYIFKHLLLFNLEKHLDNGSYDYHKNLFNSNLIGHEMRELMKCIMDQSTQIWWKIQTSFMYTVFPFRLIFWLQMYKNVWQCKRNLWFLNKSQYTFPKHQCNILSNDFIYTCCKTPLALANKMKEILKRHFILTRTLRTGNRNVFDTLILPEMKLVLIIGPIKMIYIYVNLFLSRITR